MEHQTTEPTPQGRSLFEALELLRTAEHQMFSRARKQIGLRGGDFRALDFIARREGTAAPAQPRDVMTLLDVTAAAASVITNRLVLREFVLREQSDSSDRRNRILTLTDAGRAAHTRVMGTFPAEVVALLDELPRGVADPLLELVGRTRALVAQVATAAA